MNFVVCFEGQYLKDLGRWHTLWVSNLNSCKRFNRAEAEVYALVTGGEVLDVGSL